MKIVFRKSLLMEKMRGIEELPAFAFVRVSNSNDSTEVQGAIEIAYVDKNRKALDPHRSDYPGDKNSGVVPHGAVYIAPSNSLHSNPKNVARGVWEVYQSRALPGYGPLLYDIAIEIASMKGIGLTADRHLVSSHAKKIWYYYMNNRRDVKHSQLDNINNELTKVQSDNIIQSSAEKDQENWVDSPLSKVYNKKPPSTISDLRQARKLFWDI